MNNMQIDKLTVATKMIFLAPDNTVLMLREAATNPDGIHEGKLHFPGGRIEWGETVQEGLAREVLEETGIDVSKMETALFETSEWRPKIRNEQWQIIALFFLIKVDRKPQVELSVEHDTVEWVLVDKYQENSRVMKNVHHVFDTLKKLKFVPLRGNPRRESI